LAHAAGGFGFDNRQVDVFRVLPAALGEATRCRVRALPMIANCAFLAAMTLLLLLFVVMGELEFLAPYKRLIFGQYLWTLLGALVLLFLNLFGCFYLASKALFLKETGRKLAHVERLLQTPDTIVRDLSERLARDE